MAQGVDADRQAQLAAAIMTGDRYLKYPDQVARDLFRFADVDNNGCINSLDLHRLLTLAGLDADEDDAQAMIALANTPNGCVHFVGSYIFRT